MPWLTLFIIGDFFAGLIPVRSWRNWVRRTQLYGFHEKYNSLRRAFPLMTYKNTKMIKGGQHIGFIVDKKYVFKVRRNYDEQIARDRIQREARITDAVAKILPVDVPKIEMFDSGEFLYFKYDMIPGKNIIHYSLHELKANREKLGKQMAELIYTLYNTNLRSISDLRTKPGNSWTHGDFCSNLILDPETMDIVAIIDWEFADCGTLHHEFAGINIFRKKMRDANILLYVVTEYYKICAKKKSGKII